MVSLSAADRATLWEIAGDGECVLSRVASPCRSSSCASADCDSVEGISFTEEFVF